MRRKFFKQVAMLSVAALMGTSVFGISANATTTETLSAPGGFGGTSQVQYASSPSTIVYSSMECTASSLSESTSGATTITMSDTNSSVEIDTSGTYIITGTCSEGNVVVKKNTKGVTLILKDLTLGCSTTAPVSLNKGSQVKVVISGTVNLTDNEDLSTEDTNDDFGGAAIKVKAGADVYLTGSGTLNIDASGCKNGLKSNDDSGTAFVIDGPTINIDAANDGINAGYDLTILSGKITVTAADDGIHADRILTIGSSSKKPTITVSSSVEALEGTEVIILNGNIGVVATDDGINAANSDATYSSEMDFLIDIEGGTIKVNAGADGLDSNGNINLIAGKLTIKSANNGGDAGLDYDGSCYISDDFVLNNQSGVSSDSGQGGMPGQDGQMPGQDGQMPGQDGQMPGQDGQMPGQDGQMPGDTTGQDGQTINVSDNQSTEEVELEPGEEVGDDSEDGLDNTYEVNEDGSSVTLTEGDPEAAGKIDINYISVNGVNVPVTGIANGAFKKNTAIKQVYIGSTVTTIGKNAFSGCAKLKKVTINASTKISVGKNAFKNLKAGSVIKVTGKNKKYNKKQVSAATNTSRTTVK